MIFMHRRLPVLARWTGSLLLGVALALPAVAQALQPPEIAAKSYLLLDLTSHQTLAERDADAPADPASLTKLMTAYVVFAALRDKKLTLEQQLPVSQRAWERAQGRRLADVHRHDDDAEGRRAAARA